MTDWKTHLNTLFPEARLKSTLELRSCDAQPRELLCAVPALFTGLLYDEQSLERVLALTAPFSFAEVQASREDLVTRALAAEYCGVPVRGLAAQILELAWNGLRRRARTDPQGRDETQYLEPLVRLVERGATPADELLANLPSDLHERRAVVVERTKVF